MELVSLLPYATFILGLIIGVAINCSPQREDMPEPEESHYYPATLRN